jgi:hypothetical protein
MLVVSLKRGQFARGQSWKCGNLVDVLDLDNVSLSQLLGQSQSGSSSLEETYQVDAVVEHHGPDIRGGHWTLNVREQTPTGISVWRTGNDAVVTTIDDTTKVVTESACLFLLRRNQVSSALPVVASTLLPPSTLAPSCPPFLAADLETFRVAEAIRILGDGGGGAASTLPPSGSSPPVFR